MRKEYRITMMEMDYSSLSMNFVTSYQLIDQNCGSGEILRVRLQNTQPLNIRLQMLLLQSCTHQINIKAACKHRKISKFLSFFRLKHYYYSTSGVWDCRSNSFILILLLLLFNFGSAGLCKSNSFIRQTANIIWL